VINYIWFALILIAVAFAGYKDATGVPVRSGPVPTVIVAGDSPPIDLVFGMGEEVAIPLPGLPMTFGERPATLAISISGTDVPVRIDASFTDAIGRTWEGRFPLRRMVTPEKHEGLAEKARFTRLEISSLRCADDPLETQIRHPLTLNRIVMESDGGTAENPYQVTIDEAALEYPTNSKVRSAVESETWMGVLTGSSADWAGQAITLAFNLIGIMMLWLGLMKIAEAAGLVQVIARGVKPVMVLLFPGIPADGPAMGAIVMNIAANMLGLGNAATPLGLKAMQELQELNPNKEHASNAMCMLLALNTSGVQIIPATIIGFRVAQGSTDMLFWPLMIVATTISTIVAVVVCKLLQDLPAFRVPKVMPAQSHLDQGAQE
jgi:spore maturation protein A